MTPLSFHRYVPTYYYKTVALVAILQSLDSIRLRFS
jgi:hypothetical protein